MNTAPSVSKRTPMTQATLEARANDRAHREHVHIFTVPGRSGVYTTRSKSNPAERHNLVAGPDGIIGCSCSGFYYRESCKHVEALKNRLAREVVRAQARTETSAERASSLLYA
jgi:hypothetical protein